MTGNVQLYLPRLSGGPASVGAPLCWIRGKVKGVCRHQERTIKRSQHIWGQSGRYWSTEVCLAKSGIGWKADVPALALLRANCSVLCQHDNMS